VAGSLRQDAEELHLDSWTADFLKIALHLSERKSSAQPRRISTRCPRLRDGHKEEVSSYHDHGHHVREIDYWTAVNGAKNSHC